jgi:opacity protein-like surface antigen
MMKIKTVLTSAVLAAFAASLSAQAETPKAATPYIEGQIGFADLDSVHAKSFTGNIGSATATNLSAKLDYDSSATYGAEVGLKDVLIPNLRIGASYTTVKFDLDSAKINGVVTNGGTTYTGPAKVSDNQLASVGLDFDNRVNLYMVNAYYDFKTFTNFTPFIGVGLGVADIKNAKDLEFAYSANVGAKYNITQNIYVGLKGVYTRVNGPKDDNGFNYKDIDVYTANLALGFEF